MNISNLQKYIKEKITLTVFFLFIFFYLMTLFTEVIFIDFLARFEGKICTFKVSMAINKKIYTKNIQINRKESKGKKRRDRGKKEEMEEVKEKETRAGRKDMC